MTIGSHRLRRKTILLPVSNLLRIRHFLEEREREKTAIWVKSADFSFLISINRFPKAQEENDPVASESFPQNTAFLEEREKSAIWVKSADFFSHLHICSHRF